MKLSRLDCFFIVLAVGFLSFAVGLIAKHKVIAWRTGLVQTQPSAPRRTQPPMRHPTAPADHVEESPYFVPEQPLRVNLGWGFKEGETFYVEEVMRIKSQGIAYTHDRTVIQVTRYRVLKVGDDDDVVMEMKRDGVKVTGTGRFVKADQGLFEENQDLSLQFTLAPTGEVTKVEGFVEYMAHRPGISLEKEKLARLYENLQIDDFLKEPIHRVFAFMPPGPVAKGDRWKKPVRLAYDLMGVLIGEAEYIHLGTADNNEKVAFKVTWRESESPFERCKLAGEPMSGTLLFDSAKGRLVSLKQVARLQATTEVLDGELVLTKECETTIRVLASNPLK